MYVCMHACMVYVCVRVYTCVSVSVCDCVSVCVAAAHKLWHVFLHTLAKHASLLSSYETHVSSLSLYETPNGSALRDKQVKHIENARKHIRNNMACHSVFTLEHASQSIGRSLWGLDSETRS